MARKPRIHFPGALYHCINRGNQRKPLFFSEDDYRFFLDLLAICTGDFGALVHAFCLMPNHFHRVLSVSSRSCKEGFGHWPAKKGKGFIFNGTNGKTFVNVESHESV
jgi:putative transposase